MTQTGIVRGISSVTQYTLAFITVVYRILIVIMKQLMSAFYGNDRPTNSLSKRKTKQKQKKQQKNIHYPV